MKWCPKCKQDKGLSEFHKNRSSKDGLQSWCKICRAKWGKSDPEYHKKYSQTEMGKQAIRRSAENQRYKDPAKVKARQTVNNAVRDGRLTRPDTCKSCKKEKFVQGHHEDYSKPLDVDWLCLECHRKLERAAV